MKTFLIYLCIALVAMYLVFQAALAMLKLVYVIATIVVVAAAGFLLVQAVKYFFKKRTT